MSGMQVVLQDDAIPLPTAFDLESSLSTMEEVKPKVIFLADDVTLANEALLVHLARQSLHANPLGSHDSYVNMI